jgi:hypothetical protein
MKIALLKSIKLKPFDTIYEVNILKLKDVTTIELVAIG